jgi:predicted nucleic acid-binding protein
MPYLLDTNIALRAYIQADPLRPSILHALAKLKREGEQMYVAQQSLVELGCVFTKPKNGYGLDPALAALQLRQIEQLFPILPDKPDIYSQWLSLLANPGARGRAVYDMRLVAAMLVHNVSHILTNNPDDFRRYEKTAGITVTTPDALRN